MGRQTVRGSEVAAHDAAEAENGVLESGGLGIELLDGGGGFLGGGRIRLRDPIHLRHRGIHLADTLGLLVRGRGDFADECIHAPGTFDDDLERLGDLP